MGGHRHGPLRRSSGRRCSQGSPREMVRPAGGGVQYELANGVRIPKIGETKFDGFSEATQVCDVNEGLLGMRRVVDAGHRVVSDNEGSYIEDEVTGERMRLKDEGGMYMLRCR